MNVLVKDRRRIVIRAFGPQNNFKSISCSLFFKDFPNLICFACILSRSDKYINLTRTSSKTYQLELVVDTWQSRAEDLFKACLDCVVNDISFIGFHFSFSSFLNQLTDSLLRKIERVRDRKRNILCAWPWRRANANMYTHLGFQWTKVKLFTGLSNCDAKTHTNAKYHRQRILAMCLVKKTIS